METLSSPEEGLLNCGVIPLSTPWFSLYKIISSVGEGKKKGGVA